MESEKCVGVALKKEKAEKHITPKLIATAAKAGIVLKLIDPDQSLESQEPFSVLLHKIRDVEWHQRLNAYCEQHPELRVVDSYKAVMQLTNRIHMLDPMRNGVTIKRPSAKEWEAEKKMEAAHPSTNARLWDRANTLDERKHEMVRIGVPVQLILEEGTAPEDAREAAGNAGLRAPYLGKPLYADGRDGSHGLLVIKDNDSLAQMASGPRPAAPLLPIVVQQYVPHGACLFKVYVMGPITVLVRRPSLRLPVAQGDLEEQVGGLQSVGRVSAFHSESEFGSAPQGDPPHWAIQGLANKLRQVYNLTLFNFDLIQPDPSVDLGNACEGRPDLLLLDINAFPGFEKLPDYEELYVLFLQSLFAEEDSADLLLTRFVAHSHVCSPRDPSNLAE